jgi:hypothetical protein
MNESLSQVAQLRNTLEGERNVSQEKLAGMSLLCSAA